MISDQSLPDGLYLSVAILAHLKFSLYLLSRVLFSMPTFARLPGLFSQSHDACVIFFIGNGNVLSYY